MRVTIAISVLAALTATGCGVSADEGSTSTSSTTGSTNTSADASPPTLETTPTTGTPSIGEVPDEVMADVRAAVAELAGSEAEIQIARAEAVTWSDGSLGCPKPGEFYTQALVDGYHVEVVVGDERFDFRIGGPGNIRLCESELRP